LRRIYIVAFALFLVTGCNQRNRETPLPVEIITIIDQTKLQEGDLLFRLGRSVSSRMVNIADRERSYSHIGILVKNNLGEWYVIHAVPGESHETDGIEITKRDPLLLFFAHDRTVAGTVMRFDSIKPILQKIVDKSKKLYTKRLLFDHRFALSDTTTLYCTELIHRIFLNAGVDLTEGRRHSVPFFREDIIFPSDIQRNQRLSKISEVEFYRRNP